MRIEPSTSRHHTEESQLATPPETPRNTSTRQYDSAEGNAITPRGSSFARIINSIHIWEGETREPVTRPDFALTPKFSNKDQAYSRPRVQWHGGVASLYCTERFQWGVPPIETPPPLNHARVAVNGKPIPVHPREKESSDGSRKNKRLLLRISNKSNNNSQIE